MKSSHKYEIQLYKYFDGYCIAYLLKGKKCYHMKNITSLDSSLDGL
jgi:hypothetical protein